MLLRAVTFSSNRSAWRGTNWCFWLTQLYSRGKSTGNNNEPLPPLPLLLPLLLLRLLSWDVGCDVVLDYN
jgi:hypothetical protein